MNLPQDFIDYIRAYPGLSMLEQSLLTRPDVSIRINKRKDFAQSSSRIVSDALAGDSVPWCKDGYYLRERPAFTFDVALHQGLYYVQDASSMALTSIVEFLEYSLRENSANRHIKYLDACAAPGGKTIGAISCLGEGDLVVANEYDFKRAEILSENIAKWGAPNVVVSRGNTSRISKLKDFFDIVAVDAPCSGEGMMRKDAQALDQWSPSLVRSCAATQREIIENVWSSLSPGGYLIFSTCTFNRTENEENIQWIIDTFEAEPVSIPTLDSFKEITREIDCKYPCYRFLPGKVRGEGLFVGVVRKAGTPIGLSPRQKQTKLPRGLESLSSWLNVPMSLSVIDNEIYAVPESLASDVANVSKYLDVIRAGLHIATVKGRDIIPSHSLAISTMLDRKAFVSVDIDAISALTYLRRETFSLPSDTPRGYILLSYDSIPLGFVKNLGNRVNSLLPKQWRILSQQSR